MNSPKRHRLSVAQHYLNGQGLAPEEIAALVRELFQDSQINTARLVAEKAEASERALPAWRRGVLTPYGIA